MQLAPTEAPAPTAAPTQILPQPTATPAAAPPNADASIDALRDELLQLHNQARATQNLPPYTVSPQLQQAAQAHAEWLAQKPITELLSLGAQAHTGENNSTFQARIAAAGYPGRATNESFGAFATPKEAFDWWQGDEWHRPQIFSTEYRGIGFGVVRHPSGKAMVFIVTFGDS